MYVFSCAICIPWAHLNSQERQHFLAAEAEREAHLAAQLAEQFQAESTAQLQKQRKKHEDHKQRHRAWSDATEMPLDVAGGDMVVEGFGSLVEFGGIAFSSVKIFHPRKGVVFDRKIRAIVDKAPLGTFNRIPWYDLSCGSSLRRRARNITP